MSRSIYLIGCVVLFLSAHVCSAQGTSGIDCKNPYQVCSSVTAAADKAYTDFIHRFWFGSAETGHLGIITQSQNVGETPTEIPPQKGWLWQYAEGWNVLYARWKVSGSTDASTRLNAEWQWVQSQWSLGDMSVCGSVGGQSATTQDDSSWIAMGLLQLYEATDDPNAMAFAKAAIDCAIDRWEDNTTGGGLWYEDDHSESTGKQVTNGNFALAMLKLYGDTCNVGACEDDLLENVQDLESWATLRLRRPDGLYWMYVDPNGINPDQDRAYVIAQAGSVVALFGNMGFAALDARLYKLTGQMDYLTKAKGTVSGILEYELRSDGFLDDRDARGDGYAAWDFADAVVPLLVKPRPTVDAFLTTGLRVADKDRGPYGSYGGDWEGPWDGEWAEDGYNSDSIEISANAVIWAVVAPMFCSQPYTVR